MKISRLSTIFLLCITLINCSKDDAPTPKPDVEDPDSEKPKEPETEVYFTLNTYPPPNEGQPEENWVILHDENGKLLDYSSYEAGDKLEFEAASDSLTSTISVSYLRYFESNGQKIHRISTTTGREKGLVENFGPYSTIENETPIKTGEFDILIENIPNPENVGYPVKVELSSGRGRLGVSGSGKGYSYGIELELGGVQKFEGFDDYLISILDHNNELRYYYFNNPLGEDISLDYRTDFQEMENDISFVLPENINFNLNIAGFNEGQQYDAYKGYWIHDSIFADLPTNPLRVGYTDIFSKYRTIFNITMEGYFYGIIKYGEPLEALTIPDKPNIQITDSSFNMFRFDVDIDYLSYSYNWVYSDNPGSIPTTRTHWGVSADKGSSPTIGNLPTELLEKYPDLSIDLLEPTGTSFKLPLEEGEYLSSHSLTIYDE